MSHPRNELTKEERILEQKLRSQFQRIIAIYLDKCQRAKSAPLTWDLANMLSDNAIIEFSHELSLKDAEIQKAREERDEEIKGWIEDNVCVESQLQDDGSRCPVRVIYMDDIEEFLNSLSNMEK